MVDPLSRALVAVILHDLANTTQYLNVLNSMLCDSGAGARLCSGLPETTAEVDDLGYVLGMVSFGAGADILHDRAHRDGLGVMLAFVKRALRHEHLDLAPETTPLPRVRFDAPDRGRLASWATARFVFAAAQSLKPAPHASTSATPVQRAAAQLVFAIDVRGDGARLICRAKPDVEIERCADDLRTFSPHLTYEHDATSSTLVFHGHFFEPAR